MGKRQEGAKPAVVQRRWNKRQEETGGTPNGKAPGGRQTDRSSDPENTRQVPFAVGARLMVELKAASALNSLPRPLWRLFLRLWTTTGLAPSWRFPLWRSSGSACFHLSRSTFSARFPL